MFRLVIACLAVAVLGGCAYVPSQTLDVAGQNKLKTKTFSSTSHHTLDVKVQTGGKTVLFGALAEPHFFSEGKRIMRENDIPDPAIATEQNIAAYLATQHKMKKVGQPQFYAGADADTPIKAAPTDLLAFYPDGDYLLDVDSNFWWMMYNLIDGYHVIYQSYTRLIDRQTGEPAVADMCVYDSNDNESDHPSYDEMLESKAAKLKAYLKAASEKCAKQFTEKMLKS